jgi:hypothetical protein
MGRGRTTTGMVIASLLHLRRALPALPLEPGEGLPPWFVAGDRYPSPSKVRGCLCRLVCPFMCMPPWQPLSHPCLA